MWCSPKIERKEDEASSGSLHQLRLNDDDRRELRDLIAGAAAADNDVRGLLEHLDDELSAAASAPVHDDDHDVLGGCDGRPEIGSETHISIRMADRHARDAEVGSKLYSVMRFNERERGCDSTEWRRASLQRSESFRGGLELRVQLRQRRERVSSDDVTFRGRRLAGIDDHSSYYLLVARNRTCLDAIGHVFDGSGNDEEGELVLEAHPLHHWYTFRAEQRYSSLSAEQAEAEFARRDSILNYFSLMASCRAPADADGASNGEPESRTRARNRRGPSALRLRIGFRTRRIRRTAGPSARGPIRQPRMKTTKSKKTKNLRRRRPRGSRDSDDPSTSNGDEDDEDSVGFISTSSSSDEEELNHDEEKERHVAMGSVADEGGLAEMLLSSDSDDPDAERADDDGDKIASERQIGGEETKAGEFSRAWDRFDGANESNEASVADISDTVGIGSKKRKLNCTPNVSRLKRRKLYASTPAANSPSARLITVEAVKRYLLRKPITVKDLLRKFKPKKTGLSKEETEELLMLALAEINPDVQEINGTTYYSLDQDK